MDEKDVLPSAEIMERAKAAGNTALFVISRPTGEGEDTPLTPVCYYLTEDEKALMAALRADFEKLIVVLNTGYPVEVGYRYFEPSTNRLPSPLAMV